MFKHGNKFIKPKKIDYQIMINVWVDDQKRIDVIKRLMIADKNFSLEKIRTNPVYHKVYTSLTMERDKELELLDKSLLWSRKYTKQNFKDFAIPFSIYAFVLIPFIFYKVLHKRILEKHVKHGYKAENLKDAGYWNLDFENKDLYPDSVIQDYFDYKKQREFLKTEEEKVIKYSEKFVENISRGYLSDMCRRRQRLGYNDDD